MTNTPVGNRDLIRSINRSIILNMIKTYGSISRAEIARISGLSPATVTGITAELIAENLVLERAAGDSSGGRPPILLGINPRGGYVIGIKLSEAQVVGALTDLKAGVVCKQRLPLAERSIEAVVDALAELVALLVKAGGIRKKQLMGIGLGLAGVVNSERGILRQSPYFGWRDVPLRDLLQTRLRAPVYVDNDVNTLTLSEKWFGVGQSVDNFIVLTVGRGVGMGIVIHGQLFRGKHGGAGEFGHVVVEPEGSLCSCGRRGCLEALVSDGALLRTAQELAQMGTPAFEAPQSVAELVTLADSGCAPVQEILSRAGRLLGMQIANLINIFDPEIIVISGEGTTTGEWLFGAMRTAVAQHVMPGVAEDTEIRIDPWGDDTWARGAASLVLGELFKSPVHKEEKRPVVEPV